MSETTGYKMVKLPELTSEELLELADELDKQSMKCKQIAVALRELQRLRSEVKYLEMQSEKVIVSCENDREAGMGEGIEFSVDRLKKAMED